MSVAPRSTRPRIARADVTGVVLAGGLGRRMSADGQGLDKALQPFRGRPMVAHVIERLVPQVDTLLINANRNAARYQAFGWPVVRDAVAGFAGPLAGLHAGLCASATDWVVTAPCDSPFLPPDLVDRLAGAAAGAGVRIAVAATDDGHQPVFLLAHRAVLAGLEAFLAAGERKVDRWYGAQGHAVARFDDAAAFRNINTPDDLKRFELP